MQTLFYNGPILTMESPIPAAALLEEDGVIKAVGGLETTAALAAPGARRADLQGRALLPAFIDAHSHLAAAANSFLQVSLAGAADFDELARRIKQYIRENGLAPGEWVRAGGYDHNGLSERRHPTAALLDAAAPENPVVIQHISGHMGVFNTAALKFLHTPCREDAVPGGYIQLENGRLTGYMEENAYLQSLDKIPLPEDAAFLKAFEKAQKWYLSHGITFAQEGMFHSKLTPLYRQLLAHGLLQLDIIGYAGFDAAQGVKKAFESLPPGSRFKLGGYKMFLDGSPQGRTAWLREPYLGSDKRGYATLDNETVFHQVCQAAREGTQLLAHCNGDAACEQYLSAVEKAARQGLNVQAIRSVMIHAQLLGLDQLGRVKKAGIIPSFFVAHVYHWGDVHLKNLGAERAGAISPAAAALEKNIPFTFHQDTPVIAPDMLETVWCAANRRTKAGRVLGPAQRIPVYQALRAVTANAAYQYFEEDTRGTLRPGKKADFVILSQNPLAVPPEEVRGIKVLATIKNGAPLYVSG